ncbi:acetylornithine deacetylase/succinyl-diaminopimelate desuccinylase-like protein [Actinomycetospora succinea]|uniref:Acetylornithine deacetylase/succinyl-diaminopimelate desuccinylase-like protein n=1 Tax=Actinomycetospora succinea TaxID=663603 RepID=A0A4R6V6B9_9PSEU|nr:M20/M25/M40 family metallo-hydrolase [Actinomycetospora succinea]TDQ51764.1 acetylornithine deacetylase/succinyl-diaminopimelate desuccinylase-like protein [Actinomycetospora succinea]
MGRAEDEVVTLTSELIQIDSQNTGDLATTTGEAEAAAYVDAKLREVGYETEVIESGAPGRHNVFARLEGADPSRPALLVHGHLDVVPFDESEWSVHPLSGSVQDGYVWGRGAVDMKDMDAMILALARQFKAEGTVPPRDLVFAFLADEEAGGAYGSHWLAEHRPDLFDGCTEALGEVGGFSLTLGEDVRVYPVMTAEKSIAWMKLRVRSRPGHGSMVHDENAVTILAEAVARLGRHRFPLVLTESVQGFFDEITELTGIEFPTDSAAALDGAVAKLGGVARVVGATTRDTANPTMLQAGYKANVIPSLAEATVDCRVLPGRQEAFERELDELLGPDVEREWIRNLEAVETAFDGELVDVITRAVKDEDPQAHTLPYMMSGGTDAKAFVKLGMRCFGFAPLRLPPGLDFTALFHGIDERVPVDALQFGTRVLERILLRA